MLLRAVSVRHDRIHSDTIRGSHVDFDTSAHLANSHVSAIAGFLIRTQISDFIHSSGYAIPYVAPAYPLLRLPIRSASGLPESAYECRLSRRPRLKERGLELPDEQQA
jgi:hypothetical protein